MNAPNVSGFPRALAALFVIQFLAWSAMFALWITAVPIVAGQVLHLPAGGGETLQPAIVTIALGFAGYALVGAVGAFVVPSLVARLGHGAVLGIALLIGAAGLALFARAQSAAGLVPAFAAIGVGWSAIGAVPYAIVGKMVPEGQGARTMRLFGLSTVLPQIVTTLALALFLPRVFASGPAGAVRAGAAAMALAGVIALALRSWFAPADAEADDW